MRFLRSCKGCTRRDQIRNGEIRGELGIQPVMEKVKHNRENWSQHLQRMPDNRIPKQIMKYKPRGHRSIGRPRKRWTDVRPEQALA